MQKNYEKILLLYCLNVPIIVIKNILLRQENDWKKYRDMANRLIDKEALTEHELSEIIQNLLKMSSNVEDYLN